MSIEENEIPKDSEITPVQKNIHKQLSSMTNLKWKDVEITFIDYYKITISVKGMLFEGDSIDLGFSKNRPSSILWNILFVMAANNGLLNDQAIRKLQFEDKKLETEALKKRISRIREILKKTIPIQSDPIQYKKKTGWYANFKITADPLHKRIEREKKSVDIDGPFPDLDEYLEEETEPS